jgi:hypothetical protein
MVSNPASICYGFDGMMVNVCNINLEQKVFAFKINKECSGVSGRIYSVTFIFKYSIHSKLSVILGLIQLKLS